MKKILLTLLSLSAFGALPLAARAADEHTFAFNAGAVSDYRYRGPWERTPTRIDGVRAYASPKNGDNLGKTALVVGAKYTF